MAILKNVKHEKFCQLIAGGDNQSEAYRNSGYKSKNPNSHANQLMTNSYIRDRISELKEKTVIEYDLSFERRMRDLEDALATCITNDDMTSRLKIMDMFNKMAAGYTENVNNNHSGKVDNKTTINLVLVDKK